MCSSSSSSRIETYSPGAKACTPKRYPASSSSLLAVVVVEHPAGVLGAAGLVDQAADLLVVAVPEPADAAMLAVLLPELRVDVPLAVERSHELVAVAGGAGWETPLIGRDEA